jgi:micrococcal nuclease
MQRPPHIPEDEPNDEQHDEQHDERDDYGDDLVNKVYGPSQDDIDRSWDGYESGESRSGQRLGGAVWKVSIVVVSLVILASMSLGILGPLVGGSSNETVRTAPERNFATVLRVIDGRTIVVDAGEGEQTVRLIGISTPAFGDPFFDFAQEVTHSWINGEGVMLESDELDGDGQGRLLRYVFLDNIMINAALILNGLGEAETVRPNSRYEAYLADMQRQAKEAGVGIWDESFGDLDRTNTEASLKTATTASTAPS